MHATIHLNQCDMIIAVSFWNISDSAMLEDPTIITGECFGFYYSFSFGFKTVLLLAISSQSFLAPTVAAAKPTLLTGIVAAVVGYALYGIPWPAWHLEQTTLSHSNWSACMERRRGSSFERSFQIFACKSFL